MDDAKIYNICLMRVKYQITNAKLRAAQGQISGDRVILESYNTADAEEIIDILEIYDLDERTEKGLKEKLDDLAYTVSMLVKEKVSFDYDGKGNLGLYLVRKERLGEIYEDTGAALAAA